MAENPLGVTEIGFEVEREGMVFRLRDAEGWHEVRAGCDGWIESRTDIPGRDLHHGYRLQDTPVLAGARWLDADTLAMTWFFLETAFRDTVVCRFRDGAVTLDRGVNVNSAALAHPTLTGQRLG
jgi:hypothetical protein